MRPGQIAVVFRRPQPLADLVSEVFQRLEIPFFLESGRSLSRWPAIVMLVAAAGIGCRRLADAQAAGRLGEQLLRPGLGRLERPAAGLAERTIRSLQIPRGRQRLLETERGQSGRERARGSSGSGRDA